MTTETKPKVELRRPSTMGQAVEKPKDTQGTLKRLLSYFVQTKGLFLGLMGTVLLVTITSLASPALQGQVIDALKERTWGQFRLLLGWLLVSFLLNVTFTLIQGLLAARLSQSIVGRMRYGLFEKLDHLPIGYLDRHSSGDLMSRMTNDIENISNTISQSLGSLVSGTLTIVGTIAIMFWYCWQLTLITLVTVALTALVTKWMSKKMRSAYRGRADALGVLDGYGEEMIAGYRSVTACNRQERTREEFDQLSDQLAREGVRAEVLGGSMGPMMNGITNLGFVIVAAFGGYFALEGLITIGVISAFIIYAKQFSRPLNEIAQLYGSVQTAMAGAERVFDLMDQPDEDNSGILELENMQGNISFRHVNFSYEPGKPVLQDFSLEVRAGQKIALVGATGSGKTTVVNLLMRFYPVDAGEICIDGVNITALRRDWLRHNTAIVLQDTVLFSDTIAANIKYANPAASQKEMERAAVMSNCAPFIRRLKEGYQTMLQQAGAGLSHGQRQLLNIARAILADPKILILDEATASCIYTQKGNKKIRKPQAANQTALIFDRRAAARLLSINSIRRLCWS